MHCYELRYGFDDQPLFGQAPSFYDWVMLHMNLGLRDGPSGRVEESLSVPPFGYVVLSITYFILVVLILGAVISGIIIDAFASKREETAEILLDKQSVDFVSGLKRTDFEQYGVDFDRVVGEQHSMWNYMYYKVHLNQKDPSEHDGPESYINAMIDQADPSFFPLRRCAELEAAAAAKAGRRESERQGREPVPASASDGGGGGGEESAGGGVGDGEGKGGGDGGGGGGGGGGGELALGARRQQEELAERNSVERAQRAAMQEALTTLTGESQRLGAQLAVLLAEAGRLRENPLSLANLAHLNPRELDRMWRVHDADANGILDGKLCLALLGAGWLARASAGRLECNAFRAGWLPIGRGTMASTQ